MQLLKEILDKQSIPWIGLLFEMLLDAQPDKKFPVFYGTLYQTSTNCKLQGHGKNHTLQHEPQSSGQFNLLQHFRF
jgi:hypothetical protein